jgi:hypothetical protein
LQQLAHLQRFVRGAVAGATAFNLFTEVTMNKTIIAVLISMLPLVGANAAKPQAPTSEIRESTDPATVADAERRAAEVQSQQSATSGASSGSSGATHHKKHAKKHSAKAKKAKSGDASSGSSSDSESSSEPASK